MSRAGSSAILALSLLAQAALSAKAQDTTAAAPVHGLTLDTSRVHPFRRVYDILLRHADSTDTIGTREIDVQPSVYASAPAWLITETRTGAVPALDSMFVGLDLRPLHWSSTQGLARLALEFVGDSIYGAATTPAAKQNVVLVGRRDLLASQAQMDVAIAALPLAPGWTDSASVLTVDAVSHALELATVTVVGEEELRTDSTAATPVFVVALRAENANSLYWVDRSDGIIRRVMQSVPAHLGTALEYRLRVPPPIPQSPP